MNDYQNFIAISKYARWLPDLGRRETWEETVGRYTDNILAPHLDEDTLKETRTAIEELEVMPSMRSMMTAGPAADRDNTCMYNCSYLPVDDIRSFDETMFILLCGTGVGFSVERQYISKLPPVPEQLKESGNVISVEDSKEGWARAYRQLMESLYAGQIPIFNTRQVRPAGARLETFGGRASGPGPLLDLYHFTVETFQEAKGRQLNSLECHDLMCKIGEVVVSGGVRRSAMISLSNLSDNRMRYAKTGQFPPHRYLSNNSVAYTEKPDSISFLREWTSLAESGSGERGIFNRIAAKTQAGKNGRRDTAWDFGCNPCSEIILRPYQFCNLSEVVVRAEDTVEDLERKVRIATIIGTVQSTYTHFPYLRDEWKENTEEERLLGVSLTGIMDNPLLTLKNKGLEKTLEHLRNVAVDTNREWADRLGIKQSAAITCVKPSGTVSQLVDSASGIHPRYSPYYIRTVRGSNTDPLTELMKDAGIPNEPCVYQGDKTTVFSFPTKAPEAAVCTGEVSAVDQLKLWLVYQRHWCEHKPSVTIQVKKDEWMEVGQFIWDNFDEVSGIAFLPYDDHIYQQAPYQQITEVEYREWMKKMPKGVDFSKLSEYEKSDTTKSSQTFACVGDCEIVDLE